MKGIVARWCPMLLSGWYWISDNPLAAKEMRLFLRGRGSLAGLALYLIILFSIAIFAIQAEMANPVGGNGSAGVGYLMTLVGILSMALFFLLPARAAASISQEREKRTIDLLLTSLLSPREIIVGKLLHPLGLFSFLVLLALPFFPLSFFLGGVSPWMLVWAGVWLLLGAILLSTAGILISSYHQKTQNATGSIYGLGFFFFFFGPWIFGSLAMSGAAAFQGSAPTLTFATALTIVTLLWTAFLCVEKSADNLLPEGFRRPSYFKKLFLVEYLLLLILTLLPFSSSLGSPELFGIYIVYAVTHLLLIPLFPAVVGAPRVERYYVLTLTVGGQVIVLAALALLKHGGWLFPAFSSSLVIILEVAFFSQLSHLLSLRGKSVDQVRRFLGMAFSIFLVVWIVTSIGSAIMGGSSQAPPLPVFPIAAITGIWMSHQTPGQPVTSGIISTVLLHVLLVALMGGWVAWIAAMRRGSDVRGR